MIEDREGEAALDADRGAINSAVHTGFGPCGAVINGRMRDLGDLPEGCQALAGGIGPSHGHVRAAEITTTVSIFGMDLADGDLVHADRHGAGHPRGPHRPPWHGHRQAAGDRARRSVCRTRPRLWLCEVRYRLGGLRKDPHPGRVHPQVASTLRNCQGSVSSMSSGKCSQRSCNGVQSV
ncbi:hypothetical protein [Maliponia aquimaris]|uniref:RraA family protein n=1 Tax=Maliponia aquimaris TaxID=1673631 RepID=UPI0015958FF9